MALNDIIVAKEGNGGVLSEIALAPADIGAAWALETRAWSFFTTSTYTLAQGRNVQLNASVSAINIAGTVTLPRLTTDGAVNGDELFIVATSVSSGGSFVIQRYIWTGSGYIGSTETVVTATSAGAWRFRLIDGLWTLQPVATHTHPASAITDLSTSGNAAGLYDNIAGQVGAVVNDFTFRINGDGFSADFDTANLTASRAYGLPNASGTLALTESADNLFRIVGSSDSTKKVAFEVDGLSSGTTRTLTVPNASGVIQLQGEVRSDFVTPYTYTGIAPAGTATSASLWKIRRSQYDSAGTPTATLTATNVKWDDRLTASYS